MTATASAAIETFRDPAGSLRVEGDRVRRTVRTKYASAALDFLASDLALKWVSQGDLVASRTIEEDPSHGEILLEHPRVFFPSYPWEWTPSAWIAAAQRGLGIGQSRLDVSLVCRRNLVATFAQHLLDVVDHGVELIASLDLLLGLLVLRRMCFGVLGHAVNLFLA